MARHQVGDIVRVWKPGHAEHGMQGVVFTVLTIEQYYGLDTEEGRALYGSAVLRDADKERGPHAYRPSHGWRDGQGATIGGCLPDAMVVSEEEYRQGVCSNFPSRGDADFLARTASLWYIHGAVCL